MLTHWVTGAHPQTGFMLKRLRRSAALHPPFRAPIRLIPRPSSLAPRHSYRSASIGSRLAAFRAGKNPNTTPITALTVKARTTELVEISVGNPATLVSIGASQ